MAGITLIVAVWGREEEEARPGTILNLTAEEWAYSWSVGIVGAILSFVGVSLMTSDPLTLLV